MAEHRRTAEQLGCQCEVCPLGDFWRKRNSFSPVLPEGSPDKAKLVVIGERPGPQEVKYGRPQIGTSGQLLERSVNRLGLLREDLYIDNAILCAVPGEDLEAFNSEYVSKINQTIKLKNRKLDKEHRIPRVPTPQEACRPHIRRLTDEAAKVNLPIIALGKLGWWSITGKNNAIEKVRGSFNTYVRIPEYITEAEGTETDTEEQARDLAALTTWASKRAGLLTEPTPTTDRLFGVLPRIKLSATINPAYALRKAAYRAVLERDLERVLRWHTATLRWADPTPSILSDHPTPAQLRDFLFGPLSEPDLVIPDPDDPSGGTPASWWSWDVECTREGEMLSKLRTIGIRNLRTNQSMIVPWISIDGKTGFAPSYGGTNLTLRNPLPPDRVEAVRHGVEWWSDGNFQGFHYTAEEGWEISNILRDFFRSRLRKKVGHYSGMYDGTVVERHLGVILEGGIDQILLMRIWNSELPRSLYFAGTMLTDVPSWKNAEDERSIANDPRTYRELATYNNVDLAVTGITGPVFVTHAVVNRKWPIAQLDHKVQSICREMRMTGMWVDEGVRARLEEESREKLAKERKVIAEIAGKVWAKKYEEAIREDASAAKRWRDFNPNSTAMLATLLYDDWKIPLTRLTASNKPSTDEDAIRIMLTTKGMIDGGAPNGEQRAFLNAVWRQRGFLKDLSTVILAYRKRSAGGLVFEDGVLRPGYGAHIPATGRMSSFDPNVQNVKLVLRKMIRPRPGHLFLMADYDQIELRMFSAMAGIKVYLDAFKDPEGDPHAVTAKLIYGDEFVQAIEEYKRIGKAATRYVSLRRFAKTFVYCVLYGGTEQTAYEAVSKATDPDTGELLFPNMTYHQVATCVRTWMRNAPEVQVYWDKVWKGCELNGYVEEPILGRRRDMPVFERNESLNLAIQGAAGIVMSQGLVRCREAFPPDYERGLGIVNQMHDAATIEVREEDAERLRPVMEECLTASYPDKVPGVTFTTKAKVCIDFAETDHRNAEAFAKTISKMEKAAAEVISIGSTRNQEKAQPMMARARTALEELRALTARGPEDREAQFELHAVESVIGKIRKAVEKVPA